MQKGTLEEFGFLSYHKIVVSSFIHIFMQALKTLLMLPLNFLKLLALFLAVPSKKILSALLVVSCLTILLLLLQVKKAEVAMKDLEQQNETLIEEVGIATDKQSLLSQQLKAIEQDTTMLKSMFGITATPTAQK